MPDQRRQSWRCFQCHAEGTLVYTEEDLPDLGETLKQAHLNISPACHTQHGTAYIQRLPFRDPYNCKTWGAACYKGLK
jgi:hypothetical protein